MNSSSNNYLLDKQAGSPSPDLSTPSSSETPQVIRLLYGQSIAKELLHTIISSPKKSSGCEDDEDDEDRDNPESWTAEAHFTNVNYQAKKLVLLLFINRACRFYSLHSC